MTARVTAEVMELPTYFESLMQRTPISPNDITIFLREMRRTPSGPLVTSKLLAGKIQSTSESNALRAFDFLEAALEAEVEGSIEFRTEIGRYRFLNEIIRVLSPKYLGDQTSIAVKDRAIRFLTDAAGCQRRRWFPSTHSKIEAVYSSLVESGIIQKEANNLSSMDPDAEFKKNIFERGENALLLKKLLQSKNPTDLQAANRLIKNLVDEEAKRNERRSELHSLIDRIETSTSLMMEMLSQPRIDREIVEDLASTCLSLRNKLGGIGAETNEETTSLLQASENIEKALELYETRKNVITTIQEDEVDEETQAHASATSGDSVLTFSLADELLMGMDLGLPLVPERDVENREKRRAMDNLTDNLLDLDVELYSEPEQKVEEDKKEVVAKNLVFDEIDRMSRELMDKSLIGFESKTSVLISDIKTDKRPMSQLLKNSENNIGESKFKDISPNSQFSLLDLDFLEKTENAKSNKLTFSLLSQNESLSSRANSSSEDDNLLLALESNSFPSEGTSGIEKLTPVNTQNQIITSSLGLTNKSKNNANLTPNFVLNSVRELDMEKIELVESMSPLRISVDDDKSMVGLTLTFGSFPDFPSTVKIAVIAVTNQSSTASFLNYVFQLLPPKGVQVKLLPPSCTELPPWRKRFLPPPVLTQVALILVPTISMTRLKYILSYCLEDETALHNGEFELPVY